MCELHLLYNIMLNKCDLHLLKNIMLNYHFAIKVFIFLFATPQSTQIALQHRAENLISIPPINHGIKTFLHTLKDVYTKKNRLFLTR